MQTVPSLIGTGTAIAAAASGLVFGQPIEPNIPTIRPSQPRRKISFDRDLPTNARLNSLPPSRAGTGTETPSIRTETSQHIPLSSHPSSSRPPLSHYQRPSTSQLTSPNAIVRKRSLVRQREASGSTINEGPRDSISSNGSWIKRLSIRRPLSQHGSLRSSVGPDSPSITFSYGSSAPILSRPQTAAQPLPPNKLVKRSSSMQNHDPNGVTRSRSKPHLPTLRRPATSHQRSATLQQFRTEDLPTSTSFSFDHSVRPEGFLEPAPRKTSGWISFFHSRTASIGGGIPSRSSESNPRTRGTPAKRISLVGGERQRVHLVKPRMVSTSSAPPMLSYSTDVQEEPRELREESEADLAKRSVSPENPPTSRAKRSLSMPFSPSGNWISRTSGSLRRPKRGAEPDSGNNKRHVSAPSTGAQIIADSVAPVPSSLPPIVTTRQGPTLGSAANVHKLPTLTTHTIHRRNLSSPLPPLPRDSSFHVDLPRLGSPSGAPIHPTRQNQPSGSSTSSAAMSQLRVSPLHEMSSVIESSESDTRGFTSGDDDDVDFKSDTMFDSLRTAASSRMRAVETPLESVYDESPPSTAGNGKTKRLSIQDMLGSAWDEDNKIMEEDESIATPIRASGDAETDYLSHSTLAVPRFSSDSSHNGVSLTARDFGRLSFDDDFDEDWTGDDDAPFSPLSPPSHNNSLNFRGINPNVRLALANLSVNQMADPNLHDRGDRPLSTLFDWSESPVHDKHDTDRYSSRPKTAYGKQMMDPRGGRSANRKVPTPAHIRSQSVPVVHDVSDEPKPTGAKFGTWGLGTKTVSEDWDEDFEFGIGGNDNDGKSSNNLFPVPESIRASQPSVKAHSGQIRELSLLVNDLKRLCRHGRDMDMLDGPQRALWKEAEGVIALASPDEDSMDEDHETNSSINFDAFDSNDQLDDGFDVASLSRIDAAFDGQEPMSKTAVVRERHSPKRRSVFSPEDDIFGGNWPLSDDNIQSNFLSRPRTPDTRANQPQDVTGVARSVMEAMHRSIPNQTHEARYDNKMHFDTNSLKVLVRRAGELRDSLSDIIRRAEQITQSPARTPRHERHAESSPAFTRVFDDPGSSPPRRGIRSHGNNSIIDGASPENSKSPMSRLLQTMTVS